MIKRYAFLTCMIIIGFTACKTNQKKQNELIANIDSTQLIDGHPSWIMQGNVYEVNVRQYTKEGTFKAFAKHLDRLKEMGVQTLWFMPITPIGITDRKGELGSYYAVSNYKGINPEFGTLEDWGDLVKQCHEKSFKVIIDWVPNHTSADHPWLTTHPDFYVQDSITKKALSPFDWTDARKLNYNNKELRDSMMNSMEFWIKNYNIDGFRCDVAAEVPNDFWKDCIADLKKLNKNLFMLAEADNPGLHEAGFDASYGWATFAMMKNVASGKRTADALDTIRLSIDSTYPANAIKLEFTSNHDENSWNKADYATMPGNIHAAFAVFTQTTRRGLPLIYSGQEEPVLDSISFFYKNPIQFRKFERAIFYKTLLNLRTANPALAVNANFTKITTDKDKSVYAYTRQSGNDKIFVLLNLSKNKIDVNIKDSSIVGDATNVFTGLPTSITATHHLEPWAFRVYKY